MAMSIVKIADGQEDLLSWLDTDGNIINLDLPEMEMTIVLYSSAELKILNKLQQVLIDLCTSVLKSEVRLTKTTNGQFLTGSGEIRSNAVRVLSNRSKDFPEKQSFRY